MQPYARTLSQLRHDPTGLSATQPRPRPRRGGEVPATWTGLAEGLTQVLSEDPKAAKKLGGLVDCLGLSLRVRWACGADAPRLEAWCGHPWCPACARRSAGLARESTRAWGEGVVAVELPLGRPGGLGLPSAEAVAAARVGWGKLAARVGQTTGLPRPEEFPRGVVTPDGLVLFLRGWELPERLAHAIEREAPRVGLRGVRSEVLGREAAGARLHRALLLEVERFEGLVASDLRRMGGEDETGPSPRLVWRRWTDLALSRAQEKRSIHLGGSQALPLQTGAALGELSQEPPCPQHGHSCPVEALELRRTKDGHTVWEGEPERLGAHPTRQTVSRLLDEVQGRGRQPASAGR